MELTRFQLNAIDKLTESMDEEKLEVVFKSPTGSGKTIVLTHFIDNYGKGHFDNVFIWLTPGKGSLEVQSKNKMDRYIHNSNTKLLQDVMSDGFEENDVCFINWEKLTKKGNTALKDSENSNFQEHIKQAHNNGLNFIIVIDESHQNNTVKANEIISLFQPIKIIRTSATPTTSESTTVIEVLEEDVIAEGLIKKMLVINENFERTIEVNSQVNYLLDQALSKQNELTQALRNEGSNVNPLIIIQLPNKSDILLDEVERYLATKKITYDNQLLAVWLNNKKENLEDIENIEAKPIVIIIKQAVATGWDCPRAQILVKLRENTDETFEIQTIGRIRRMPEVKHYNNDLLDSCYLYTFDKKFTEGVKLHLGSGALDAVKLFLKNEHKDVSFVTELKTDLSISKDATRSLRIMSTYFQTQYGTTTKTTENKTRLKTNKYIFSDNIIKETYTGEVHLLTIQEFQELSEVKMIEPLNTHIHGREYHNRVSLLGLKLGLSYEQMNTIIRRLFDKNVRYDKKILRLETREVYAFVINNFDRLKNDFSYAMSNVDIQQTMDITNITKKTVKLPRETLFTYNTENKIQQLYESNVYDGYLSSAEFRSDSEKTFEKYCEVSKEVDWFYKNGDKGIQYLSIVYEDNAGIQRSFYPDYILSVKGEIWIIETKGGFSRYGASEDIDIFSQKKFLVLKRYLNEHNLKGGFVRKDKKNNELFICLDNYNDDIKSDSWIHIDKVLS